MKAETMALVPMIVATLLITLAGLVEYIVFRVQPRRELARRVLEHGDYSIEMLQQGATIAPPAETAPCTTLPMW